MIDRVLIFDLRADYAHFKKYYTTTSPLTFSLPPKTVIYGIVGAIIGLSKNQRDDDYYLKYFQGKKCLMGLQILKPIKKTRIGLNLIDTKTAKKMSKIINRTQIRTEFIKEAAYRIYFYHYDKEIYRLLKKNLEKHHSIYTISLGLSENLANYNYLGEYGLEKINDNDKFLEINSVLRIKDGNLGRGDIDFTLGREYFSDQVAIEMKVDREVIDYGVIIYERNGEPIKARPKTYYKVNNKNIILF